MINLIFSLLLSAQAFAAPKIINADIAASGTANIARNKLAAGTAYAWCTNDSSGYQTSTAVTASRAVATDANGAPVASATTATELGYVSGVTSAIQTQLNGKVGSVGAFSAVPTATGLTISGSAINMDPADSSNPGGVSITTQSFAGAKTLTTGGAASTPGLTMSGAPFAGTATTSKALMLLENGSPTSTNWGTVGNYIGINQPSGGTANMFNFQVNGADVYRANYQGGFVLWNTNDNANYLGSLTMCNGTANPASNANCTSLYQSGGQVFNIYSPNATQGATNMLRFSTTVGNASFGGATPSTTGWLLVRSANFAAYNAYNSLEVQAKTSQTGDLQQWQDSSGTELASVDVSGNFNLSTLTASNVVVTDGSKNLTSSTTTALLDALTSCNAQGAILYRNASAWVCLAAGTSGHVLTTGGAGANPAWAASGAASAQSVLTKTADYTIQAADFNGSGMLLLECNCSSNCTQTLPAASNSGFQASIINVGSATCTVAAAGSDTFGSTADQTWVMPAGGNPQVSNIFIANGGARWNGF